MYLRWIALFLFFWIAHSSNAFSVELDNKGDSVWEIESLEPGDFDYDINKGKVVLSDRFRILLRSGVRVYLLLRIRVN